MLLTWGRMGLVCLVLIAEGVRFETLTAPETLNLDLVLSFRSQSLTEESEAGEEPIKPDGTR